jgi:hypothetical protein
MSALCEEKVSEEKFIIFFDEQDEYNIYTDYTYELSAEDMKEIEQWREIERQTLAYYDLSNIENYIRWYVHENQGTLEQPYTLLGDRGEILTAKSFFNCKAKTMVEMKLLFDESQLEKVKEFLLQIGFVFEDLSSMFDMLTIADKDDCLGTINNPIPLNDNDGDMLYAYNCFNSNNRMMSEMRIVFCLTQLESVLKLLKTGGFNL